MYTRTHTLHTQTHMYAYMYTHTHVHMHVHTWTHMCTHTCTCTHTHTHTHTHHYFRFWSNVEINAYCCLFNDRTILLSRPLNTRSANSTQPHTNALLPCVPVVTKSWSVVLVLSLLYMYLHTVLSNKDWDHTQRQNHQSSTSKTQQDDCNVDAVPFPVKGSQGG